MMDEGERKRGDLSSVIGKKMSSLFLAFSCNAESVNHRELKEMKPLCVSNLYLL